MNLACIYMCGGLGKPDRGSWVKKTKKFSFGHGFLTLSHSTLVFYSAGGVEILLLNIFHTKTLKAASTLDVFTQLSVHVINVILQEVGTKRPLIWHSRSWKKINFLEKHIMTSSNQDASWKAIEVKQTRRTTCWWKILLVNEYNEKIFRCQYSTILV